MTDEVKQVSRLDALYNDDKPPAAEATAQAASEEKGAGDKGEVQQPAERTPAGSEAAAANPADQDAPPASQDDEADIPEDVKGLKAALVATRKKSREQLAAQRQELEEKFAKLEKRVDRPAPQQRRQEAELPDPIVDPAGFAQALDDRNFVRLVDSSRADMIDEVGEEDFAAKEAAFEQAVAADPKLADRLRHARDPGRFAYNQGKKFLEGQQKKPDDDEAAYAKFKDRLSKDFDLVPKQPPAGNGQQQQPAPAAKPPSPAKTRPRLPTSLADVQSGSPRGNAAAGDKPLGRRSLSELYGD